MMSLLPLYCLAPVSWYGEALKGESLVLGIHETFPKQTLRNRIIIPTANNLKTLSIPIEGKTKHCSYKDVRISYAENWRNQWLQTLATAYGKSPFYEFYDYRFEAVFNKQYAFIYDLNRALLDVTLQCLKADIAVTESDDRFEEKDGYWESRSALLKPYTQVFMDRHGFQSHVSIADLIFNAGPNALTYLKEVLKDT